jgi:hypothetical protein
MGVAAGNRLPGEAFPGRLCLELWSGIAVNVSGIQEKVNGEWSMVNGERSQINKVKKPSI